MEQISEHYADNVRWFDETLGAGRSCDMVCRDLQIGGRRGRIWVIDGFGGDAILERMGAFWLSLAWLYGSLYVWYRWSKRKTTWWQALEGKSAAAQKGGEE